MINTYYNQLLTISKETGWDLKEACIDAGISDTTYYRWLNKTHSPREKQAQLVAAHMVKFRR
jgi:hypothetical protein